MLFSRLRNVQFVGYNGMKINEEGSNKIKIRTELNHLDIQNSKRDLRRCPDFNFGHCISPFCKLLKILFWSKVPELTHYDAHTDPGLSFNFFC